MLRRHCIVLCMIFLVVSCGSDTEDPDPDPEPSQDASTGMMDSSTVTDAGDEPEDVGNDAEVDAETDAETDAGLTCDEGRINLDGDDSNGCESPDFPAFHDEACQPCWSLPNAIAGCNAGTCRVVGCLEGTIDRDGDPMNGCEATCVSGECLKVGVSVQKDFVSIDDRTLGRGVATSLWNETSDSFSYVFPNGVAQRTTPPVKNRVVLEDNRIVGVADDKLMISDDLGLTYREGTLPDGYVAMWLAEGPNGGVMVADTTEAGPDLHLLVSDDYLTWTVDSSLTLNEAFSFFVTPSALVINNELSIDGGQTWSNVPIPFLTPNDVAESSSGTIIVASTNVLLSRDNGQTWDTQTFSVNASFARVVEWLNDSEVLVGGDGMMAYSPDDGETWITQELEGSIRHIVQVPGGEFRAFTATGHVYSSTTGQVWLPMRDGGGVPPRRLHVGDLTAIGDQRELAADGREFTGPWVPQWPYASMFPVLATSQFGGVFSVQLGFEYFGWGADVSAIMPDYHDINVATVPGCAWCSGANLDRQVVASTSNAIAAFAHAWNWYTAFEMAHSSNAFLRNTGGGWDYIGPAGVDPGFMIPTALGFISSTGHYSNDHGLTLGTFNDQGCLGDTPYKAASFLNGEVLAVAGDVCLATNGGENWSTILAGSAITPRTGFAPGDLAIIRVDGQELVYLTLSNGAEAVVVRSEDRGLTWQEMFTVPPNATLTGTGSRMAIVIPQDTTIYQD